MSKVIFALLSLLVILVLDSLARQSSVLSTIDFAGIYLILVWFNLSRRSEEGTWAICLVISIIFGIFRQQNLGELIIALTAALIITNAVLQFSGRNMDYHLLMVLTFFSSLVLVSSLLSGGAALGRDIIFIVINSTVSYIVQFMIMRRVDNSRHGGYKYK